jgi:hypothetical protein
MKKRFEAISDPQSPEYQQYMTRDDIIAMSSPPAIVYDTINDWLATVHTDVTIPSLLSSTNDRTNSNSNGNSKGAAMTITNHGDAIEVNHMPLYMAEPLFDTRFGRFHHRNGVSLIRQYGMVTAVISLLLMLDGVCIC